MLCRTMNRAQVLHAGTIRGQLAADPAEDPGHGAQISGSGSSSADSCKAAPEYKKSRRARQPDGEQNNTGQGEQQPYFVIIIS